MKFDQDLHQIAIETLTRRHFLKQGSVSGLGAVALTSLPWRGRIGGDECAIGGSARAETSAISCQGEECHLPLHGRGTIAA